MDTTKIYFKKLQETVLTTLGYNMNTDEFWSETVFGNDGFIDKNAPGCDRKYLHDKWYLCEIATNWLKTYTKKRWKLSFSIETYIYISEEEEWSSIENECECEGERIHSMTLRALSPKSKCVRKLEIY